MAQKSGMLAAESIFDAIADEENQITEGLMLHNYEQKIKDSSIHKELHAVRNVKPAFAQYGLFGGMAYTGLFYVLGRGKQLFYCISGFDMLYLVERRNSQNLNYLNCLCSLKMCLIGKQFYFFETTILVQ